ncbi:alpha/beta fold hydrolase [Marinomonas atlantica]|uniref:alpha/beta fold hydrolase n=1 Tax=Marinomonas atlantica TaxID=1806668 RepID=UPI00083183B4|nr:alpha/beta hydrolase [Marinomonas atlantica]
MLSLNSRFKYKGQSVAWGCLGKGKPMVLIHGTPFSSQVWRKIAPLLGQHYKVYFFDLLGYGQSEKREEQNVSLGVQNNLLTALLEFWGLDQPELVCHDFGGATALRAHFLNGIQFSRLTLIDPVAIAPWGSPFVQHVRQYEKAFTDLPAYAHDALLKAYLQGAAFTKLSDATLGIHMAPWQGEAGQAAFYRQISQMDQQYTDEIEGLYSVCSNPVQILWGEQDEWIPLAQGQKLAERLTAGKLVRVPESGHLMQEDAPEAIVAALLT